jgi:DNA-binding GntR family transcriptional regulator
MPTTDATESSPALVDEIAQAIQADVLSGRLASGTKLRQEALANRFGVSRTPIREALRKLEAARVIEVIPHRGALVRTPTPKEIRDAYLVRSELEGLAAELAARWIQDEQLEQLRKADELFSRAVQEFVSTKAVTAQLSLSADVDWIRANDLFHEVIFEAAGNDLLKKLIGDLHQVFPRQLTWLALSRDSHLLSSNVVQHRQIREAIERRDSIAARELMTNHVQRAGELVVISVERALEANVTTSSRQAPSSR